jgi:hypothetical protein
MILLASLRSDEWTAWSELVDDFIGPRNCFECFACVACHANKTLKQDLSEKDSG